MLARETAISFRFTSHPNASCTAPLGEPCRFSDVLQRDLCGALADAVGQPPEIQIHEERGRLAIVTDRSGIRESRTYSVNHDLLTAFILALRL